MRITLRSLITNLTFLALGSGAIAGLCRAQPVVSTLAGTGVTGFSGDGGAATSARLGAGPGTGGILTVSVDNNGNPLIVDGGNRRIRRVSSTGIITTVAGGGGATTDGGQATAASIFPSSVSMDAAGNLYIAQGASVRKVSTTGVISTIAGGPFPGYSGDGGPATAATLFGTSVAADPAGNVYIADSTNSRIRKIDAATGIITTVAGNGKQGFSGDGGPATGAMLSLPQGVAADGHGNVYFADNGSRVRRVDASGTITTVAGNGSPLGFGDGGPATATGMTPNWVAVDNAGNLYIVDSAVKKIRKVTTAGIISTIAGGAFDTGKGNGDGGPATAAVFVDISSVGVDAAGNVYISDPGADRVRKVTVSSDAAGPSIAAGGIVSGASFQPGIVANSWATIQGSNLASVTDTWANSIVNGRLPATLDGVTVTVGGTAAYLYYVSPSQINFVVPNIPAGPTQVVVKTPAGTSSTITATVSQFAPAFFPWPNGQPVATRQDFSFAAAAGTFAGAGTVPAKPGDTVILWGTGFGPTTPAAPSGVQLPADQTYSTTSLPSITINNVAATVYGAALAPGFAGLYQVAIQIPSSLADGNWPVVATIGGVPSPAGVLLTVKR